MDFSKLYDDRTQALSPYSHAAEAQKKAQDYVTTIQALHAENDFEPSFALDNIRDGAVKNVEALLLNRDPGTVLTELTKHEIADQLQYVVPMDSDYIFRNLDTLIKDTTGIDINKSGLQAFSEAYATWSLEKKMARNESKMAKLDPNSEEYKKRLELSEKYAMGIAKGNMTYKDHGYIGNMFIENGALTAQLMEQTLTMLAVTAATYGLGAIAGGVMGASAGVGFKAGAANMLTALSAPAGTITTTAAGTPYVASGLAIAGAANLQGVVKNAQGVVMAPRQAANAVQTIQVVTAHMKTWELSQVERGMFAYEMRQMTDANGNKIPNNVIDAASTAYGLGIYAIEALGMAGVYGIGRKFGLGSTVDAIENIQGKMNGWFKQGLLQGLIGVGVENEFQSLQEGAEQFYNRAVEYVAKKASDYMGATEYKERFWPAFKFAMKDSWDTFVESSGSFAVSNIIPSTLNLAMDAPNWRVFQNRQQQKMELKINLESQKVQADVAKIFKNEGQTVHMDYLNTGDAQYSPEVEAELKEQIANGGLDAIPVTIDPLTGDRTPINSEDAVKVETMRVAGMSEGVKTKPVEIGGLDQNINRNAMLEFKDHLVTDMAERIVGTAGDTLYVSDQQALNEVKESLDHYDTIYRQVGNHLLVVGNNDNGQSFRFTVAVEDENTANLDYTYTPLKNRDTRGLSVEQFAEEKRIEDSFNAIKEAVPFVSDAAAYNGANAMEDLAEITGRSAEELRSTGILLLQTASEEDVAQRRKEYNIDSNETINGWMHSRTQDGREIFEIHLTKDTKATTIAHEVGHIIRAMSTAEQLAGFVGLGGFTGEAGAQWSSDIKRTADGRYQLGDKIYDTYKEASRAVAQNEENFVHMYLEYKKRGIAPNESVRSTFERMSRFMNDIRMKTEGQLTPEAAAALDQLFNTSPEGGQRTLVLEATDALERAYHGSAADFSEFSLEKIGTGEGAQAFGWGLYVTDSAGIGKSYAKDDQKRKRTNRYGLTGESLEFEIENFETLLQEYELVEYTINKAIENGKDAKSIKQELVNNEDILFEDREDYEYKPISEALENDNTRKAAQEIKKLVRETTDYLNELKNTNESAHRNLYKVEIPDWDDGIHTYLQWDEIEDPDYIVDKLNEKFGPDGYKVTHDDLLGKEKLVRGSTLYERLALLMEDIDNWYESFNMAHHPFPEDEFNYQKLASQFLHDIGYTGIRYEAERHSRIPGQKARHYNYVLFDPKDIEITQHWTYDTDEEGRDFFETTAYQEHEQNISDRVKDDWDSIETDIRQNPEKYYTEDGKLKAPNGKPSNLEYNQYVMVRTPAFVNWFGDWINDPENASKVVDENGEPLVVYHGSRPVETDVEGVYKYNDFSTFDVSRSRDIGIHFSEHEYVARQVSWHPDIVEVVDENGNPTEREENVFAAFLNIRTLLPVFDFFSTSIGDIETSIHEMRDTKVLSEKSIDRIEKAFEDLVYNPEKNFDYDGKEFYDVVREELSGLDDPGFVYENYAEDTGGKSYAVLDANQIKSATANNGEFSQSNDNIYFETAAPVESKEFRNWFKESKVVDEQGNPLIVYHGTNSEFDTFRTANKWGYSAAYFTDNPNVAKVFGSNQKAVYLSLQNPLEVDAENRRYDEILFNGKVMDTQEIAAYARDNGYDGVIVRNVKENGGLGTDYLAFDPDQIRSVPADASTLFETTPNPQIFTDNFKAWFGDWQNDPEHASKVVNPDGTPMVLYHGSPIADIQIFSPTGRTNNGEGLIYATNEKTVADIFAKEHVEGSSAFRIRFTGNIGEVYPLYMNMKHPLDFRNLTDDEKALITKLYAEDWYLTDERAKENFDMAYEAGNHQYVKDMARRIVNNLPAYGYDGLIANMLSNWQAEQDGAQYQEYAVVSSNQVKSAERNNGEFSANEENYLFETSSEKISNLEAQKAELIKPYESDIERALELGEYVASEYLEYFKDREWAKDVLEIREMLQEMPELVKEMDEAENFEDWFYTSQYFDGFNASPETRRYLEQVWDNAHLFTPEQQDRVFAQEWTASDEKMLELAEKLQNYRTVSSSRQKKQNPGRIYSSRFGAYKGVSRDVLWLRRNDGTSASGKTYTRSTHEEIEAAKKKVQENPTPYRLAYLQAYGANDDAFKGADWAAEMEYGVRNLNYKLDQLMGTVDEQIANELRRKQLRESGQGYKVTIEDLRAKIARAEEDLKDLQIDKDVSEKELRAKLEDLQGQYERERDLHELYRRKVEELKSDKKADEKAVRSAQERLEKQRQKYQEKKAERDKYKKALDALKRKNDAMKERDSRIKTMNKILKAANFSNSTLDVSYEPLFAWVRNLFEQVDRKDLYQQRRTLMSQLSEATASGDTDRAAEVSVQLEDVRQRIKASESIEIPENARSYFNDAIVQKADNRQSAWTQEELDYLLSRVKLMREDAKAKLEQKINNRNAERARQAEEFFRENYGTRPEGFIREAVQEYPDHDKIKSEIAQKIELVFKVANATPARAARYVDGQNEGVAYNLFVRKAWQAQANEVSMYNQRTEAGAKKAKELGIKPAQLRKQGYSFTKDNGETVKLTRGQMIGVYVYSKSDVGAQKIMSILGNGIPRETAIDIVNQLTDAEKAWGDYMVYDMSFNAWDRIAAVMENEYNMSMGRRENYFPLVAAGKITEGEGDLLAGPTQLTVRYADKGFTKAVNPYAIYELDLDVTDNWLKQVRRQEHFISYAAWARETNYLLGRGGMGDVIKQKYGNNYLQNLQDYVNFVGSPQVTMDNLDKTFASLIGRFAGSKVIGNISAMLKQIPTIAAAIGNTGVKEFFGSVVAPKVSLNQFLVANNMLDPDSDGYANIQKFIFENAPEMKNRRYGALLLEGMDSIGRSSFDAFRNEMNARIGQYTLNLTDGFVTQRLWLARYMTVMEELRAAAEKAGVEFDQNKAHEEARFKASQLISETQNTAVRMDLSQNLRKAAGGNMFYKSTFLFGSATMNVFNMMAYDMPYLIKNKKIGKALSTIAFVLINIASMMAIGGVFARKDGEDDEEYAKRVAEEAAMQVVGDVIPGWGTTITNAYQGYSGSSTMSLFEDVGSTARKLTSADEWSDVTDILSWLLYAGASAAGLPATAGKKIWQSVSELNPGYLINKNLGDWFEEEFK